MSQEILSQDQFCICNVTNYPRKLSFRAEPKYLTKKVLLRSLKFAISLISGQFYPSKKMHSWTIRAEGWSYQQSFLFTSQLIMQIQLSHCINRLTTSSPSPCFGLKRSIPTVGPWAVERAKHDEQPVAPHHHQLRFPAKVSHIT